jgi:hypothetical protein
MCALACLNLFWPGRTRGSLMILGARRWRCQGRQHTGPDLMNTYRDRRRQRFAAEDAALPKMAIPKNPASPLPLTQCFAFFAHDSLKYYFNCARASTCGANTYDISLLRCTTPSPLSPPIRSFLLFKPSIHRTNDLHFQNGTCHDFIACSGSSRERRPANGEASFQTVQSSTQRYPQSAQVPESRA